MQNVQKKPVVTVLKNARVQPTAMRSMKHRRQVTLTVKQLSVSIIKVVNAMLEKSA